MTMERQRELKNLLLEYDDSKILSDEDYNDIYSMIKLYKVKRKDMYERISIGFEYLKKDSRYNIVDEKK